MPDGVEFSPGQTLYLRAFNTLMNDRNYDAAGSPLPLSYLAVSQYARDLLIPAEEFETFCRMLRVLDDVWRRHARSKTPSPATITR